MILRLAAGNKEYALQIQVRDRRKTRMYGYTNRCKDGRYIVMLDHDNIDLHYLEEELKHLQEHFQLSNFYVFQSSTNSYHSVCFDKVTLSQLVTILKNSSVDPNYINVPLHYGRKMWTLRVSEKNSVSVQYIKTIMSSANRYEKSHAHIALVQQLFKIAINNTHADKEKDLVLSTYLV